MLDVGAGDAPYRELFEHTEYVTVDWDRSVHKGARSASIIASADMLPVDDGSVDLVLLTQVLEHVPDPASVLAEMARVLKPGGTLYATVPFGTVDWFRWLDRERFAPSLITTQPSANRRIGEVEAYAEEVWSLPDLMPGQDFPGFLFDFIHSRSIRVLHIMNSRLAFDLLPDLSSLSRPPAVVVQLHVEEQDRSGYVRYVTTRYGNLVDAFSVTSRHLADIVAGYDIPRSKIHVIYSGVDPEGEFSPPKVRPLELDTTGLRILFAGRLVEQKDPLLMVDIAARLAARRSDAVFHVVGEGRLEPAVRAAVHDRGLDCHVRFEGPSSDLAPWYAACDVLLMTSVFEGVPYSVYEAMAMEVPVVAPALPGNVELVGDVAGVLIDPRDDVEAYVEALDGLGDEPARRRIGAAARERVRADLSLGRMAEEHGALYISLLDERPRDHPIDRKTRLTPEAIDLAPRPSQGQPTVSVIVPCFNHGRYLPSCLDAIVAQTYLSVEVILVDDASTDAETRAVLDEVERSARALVVRQPTNRGPSAARNAALERATGRYILPVDADNVLLPEAIERLVQQLQSAAQRVGFIYPNLQYFGNRDDYFEAPDYNLYALLEGNYCDTCSLLDRGVFDAGVRYDEYVGLGHEDWDLALSLAARGIRGEPATGPTLLYRKHGFTRSDLVEYAPSAYAEGIVDRHPDLFSDASIKPRWCPGLSLVCLEPVDVGSRTGLRLAERLAKQTLVDVELLAAFDGEWPLKETIRAVRRIPPALVRESGAMFSIGLTAARGRRVLVVERGLCELLADPAFLEKLLRVVRPMLRLDACAIADFGGALPFGPPATGADVRHPHAVLVDVARAEAYDREVELESGKEVARFVGALIARGGRVEWRHGAGPSGVSVPARSRGWLRLAHGPSTKASSEAVRELRRNRHPRLPGSERAAVRRWQLSRAWIPPETIPLVRHRHLVTGRRIVTNDRTPPEGYIIEYDLGVVQRSSPPGSDRLEADAGGGYRLVARGSPRPPRSSPDRVLGHVEQAPLPMLATLMLGFHEPTGEYVLCVPEDDCLLAETRAVQTLGWIEQYPIQPRQLLSVEHPDYGISGLLRAVDYELRRHLYGVGSLERGELVVELGGLMRVREEGCIAAMIRPDGKLQTERHIPSAVRPSARQLARWSLAPLNWRGFGRRRARARSVARRSLDAPRLAVHRLMASDAPPQARRPVGYLYADGGPGRLVLFSAIHPITGDQLLTRDPREATDMGYANVTELGYLRERYPVTGTLEKRRRSVPWASRFGLA